MLKINQITQAFGDKVILDDVSFEAHSREIIGLVAPNGTGKTTLLNILMDFLSPQEGKITIEKDNETIDYSSIKSKVTMHENIIFLPELEDLYGQLSGLDHLKLYAKLWGESTERVPEIIEKLNIDSYVRDRVSTYSLGMRQRLCFAMLLCANPPIMLMDEVMNGLDPDNVTLLTNILIELKQEGKIILIASHLLDNLDIYVDRVAFMKEGKLKFLDEELTKQSYLKVEVGSSSKEQLLIEDLWAEDAHIFGDHLLAIPIKNKSEKEMAQWIEKFLKNGYSDFSINSIGTSEWYEEFYE